jgi:PAS domain S-box-containing protein
VKFRAPGSLQITVPAILLVFAAILSAVNLWHHVPRAERAAAEDSRKLLAQEMSRLQSTLEYLLLKGDLVVAQHEIAVLAHNHDYTWVALTDDQSVVIAASRRAWLGQPIGSVLPMFDPVQATDAVRARRASIASDATENVLIGYAGILMGRERDELRPSRAGTLVLAYDLTRAQSEARARVLEQSLYWAGWVVALALVLWLAFHFLLTRRTARLVHAAERLAAGDLTVRSGLFGRDELGRLGRAFDAMALKVAQTQRRLRDEIGALERADQALRVSEASYRAIFDATEDAVFVLDIDSGAVIDANVKACAVYGHTREELLQVDTGRLRVGESHFTHDRAMELIARARVEGTQHFEWHLRHRDGTLYWEDVHVKRVNLGGRDRLLALTRDITEKKRAANELEREREAAHQREKLAALGSLLAGVAHELNNPLSVVIARAVLLEEQGDPVTRAAAGKIRTAAERCTRIVRTFLGMARDKAPERVAVHANVVINSALDIAVFALREAGVEVTLNLADDLPMIEAEPDQLHQVILNLIINAQQSLQERAAPRRLWITSRLDAVSDRLYIDVADNGPGIPVHLRARVFEPYFTTKPVGIGTGVGLAVSLAIAEAHGGTLTLDCPAVGGAVFTVALPRAASTPPRAPQSSASVNSYSPK